MTITKDDARQEIKTAIVDFTFADFTSGTFLECVDLPLNAILLSGALVIDTVFNSGTSDTLTVGDSGDVDEYKAGIDGTAAALTELIPTGYVNVLTGMGIRWTGVGAAPTTGAGRLIATYMVDGRATSTQD